MAYFFIHVSGAGLLKEEDNSLSLTQQWISVPQRSQLHWILVSLTQVPVFQASSADPSPPVPSDLTILKVRATPSGSGCYELMDFPKSSCRRFFHPLMDTLSSMSQEATHFAYPVWNNRSSHTWILLKAVSPASETACPRRLFFQECELRPYNECCTDRLLHHLHYRLQVAHCLLSRGYLSSHSQNNRNDVLHLSRVIDALSHRHCKEENRESTALTIPVFLRIAPDHLEGKAEVSVVDNKLARVLSDFFNWRNETTSSCLRKLSQLAQFSHLRLQSVTAESISNSEIHGTVKSMLRNRSGNFESLPTWASHVLHGDGDSSIWGDGVSSCSSSGGEIGDEIAIGSSQAPVKNSQSELQRQSARLRPWARGIEWADDDSGWEYTVLTESDDVERETAYLAEHGGTVETAYVAAVRLHRQRFHAAANAVALTMPVVRHVRWVANLLSWRLEHPRGSFRFFSVEDAGGVSAAWSRAVSAGHCARKRRCCSLPGSSPKRHKAEDGDSQPSSSQDLPAARDEAPTKETLSLATPTASPELPDLSGSAGWNNLRLSEASTRASVAATSPRIVSSESLQAEAVKLQPYPPGVIWARTTLRWFAIYKEDGAPRKRKKFKTFDPKKFDGNCSAAFHAAVKFLEDKDPWSTRRSETTTTTSQALEDQPTSFPIV